MLRQSTARGAARTPLIPGLSPLLLCVAQVEQAIQRDAFPNIERVPNPNRPGRTLRVWIPRADLEAEAARRGVTLREPTSEAQGRGSASEDRPRPASRRRTPPPRAQGMVESGQQTIWQQEAEELLQENFTLRRENLSLRVRLRELEAELGALRRR